MGVLAQEDLRDEVRSALGNRSPSDIPDVRITRVLNLAQSRITRAYDFSELSEIGFAQMNFTRNAAVDKYLIPPPRTKTIHSFVVLDTSSQPVPGTPPPTGAIGSLGQSRKVVEKPWRWFDQKYPAPEWLPPGWPSIYKRFGNIITMVPAPFLQFTAMLSFTQYPTPFDPASEDQVSDFENKDDVLINYALAYFFKTLGRADRAAYFEALAKEQLDEAIERDDTRPDIEISRDVPSIASAEVGPYWASPWVKYSP